VPAYEIHIPSIALPREATIARALKHDGLRSVELLEHAVAWGADLGGAWDSCDCLELIFPLALLRGVARPTVTRALRELVIAVRVALPHDLGWENGDRLLAFELLDQAIAPDLDVARLDELRGLAMARAGAKGGGRHRYRLLQAAAHVAELGLRRDSIGTGLSGAAWLAADLALGALVDEDGAADLFSGRVDVEAFRVRGLELARSRMETA
jgi:hypothetical protein